LLLLLVLVLLLLLVVLVVYKGVCCDPFDIHPLLPTS